VGSQLQLSIPSATMIVYRIFTEHLKSGCALSLGLVWVVVYMGDSVD
jgi:hypothetical protein